MTDIRTILQDFAEAQSWKFLHARRDFQNLHDVTDFIHSETEGIDTGESIMFLDPIIRKPTNDRVTVSGSFMILTNSDLDMTYEQKYVNYIAPLINLVQVTLYNKIRCTYDINDFTVVELINVLDFNGDGVHVSFNLTGYDRTFTIPEIAIPAATGADVTQDRSDYIYDFTTPASSSSELVGVGWVIQFSEFEDFAVVTDEFSGTYSVDDFDTDHVTASTGNTLISPDAPGVYSRIRNSKNGVLSDWFVKGFGIIIMPGL